MLNTNNLTEPLVGWRLWVFSDNKLKSWITSHGIWDPGIPFYSDFTDPHSHTGVHAFKNELFLREGCEDFCYHAFMNKIDELYGEVYLWGKIIEHELGYRAEYVYPKKVYCKTLEQTQLIRQLYGCETELINANR